MKKKIKYILLILLILHVAFNTYKDSKLPSPGEYYIVKFNNKDMVLEQNDKEKLYMILKNEIEDMEDIEDIEIIELVYRRPTCREDTCFCITFKKNGEMREYKYDNMGNYTERRIIGRIAKKYYKWWNDNKKHYLM